MKSLALPENLSYFARWLEIINLEQSAVNMTSIVPNGPMNMQEKVKEEGLKITEMTMIPGDDPVLATFNLFLERPYYQYGKKNCNISAGTYINLHTKNSISFTKGLVLKKHKILKKQGNS